jgi:predicted TIM-barrel fold metal-dependent hydrolase
MNRRHWLTTVAGMTALAGNAAGEKKAAPAKKAAAAKNAVPKDDLPLRLYEPKSMLHVPETKVPKAKFPVIDIHTHLSFSSSLESTLSGKDDKPTFTAKLDEILPVMDRKGLQILCNTTGGWGKGLEQTLEFYRPNRDRFFVFTEPAWAKTSEAGYAKWQGDEIERAAKLGAKGLKILKTLGLFLREKLTTGPLVKVDDPRFDPMWEAAGANKLPVGIHVSDPEAFFLPIDKYNERWEELHAHPDWSFHGKDFPSNKELMEARNRIVARHPNTNFIYFHVGDAEDLPWVSEWLDKYPNVYVELGARVGELGRQPRMSRKFFDKYQDRILFGTDAIPHGDEYPQQVFNDLLYEIYYRFLETEDEYFDYAPAKIPPQGRWRISGLGLPDEILRKVYNQNAARLLNVNI